MEADSTLQAQGNSEIALFVGVYQHSLDPKKRLTIPSVWRASIGEPKSLYVLPDFEERCLNLIPAAEMAHKLEQLRRYSLSNAKAQAFLAKLGSNSDLLTWDTQGRIRISDRLLNFAGVGENVVLEGAFNKFRLWAAELRESTDAIDQTGLAEAAQYVDF